MWKDLSMKKKAALIKEAVKYKMYSLDDIKNSYDDGGYLSYMEKLAEKKAKKRGVDPDLVLTEMLNDNTYNYKAFYDNDREEALKMLEKDADDHFDDIGKTVYHPTFSNESMYSGKKSQYNPRGTVGGRWRETNKGWEYIPSSSQIANGDFNYKVTSEYIKWAGNTDYIDSRYNKFDVGGPTKKTDSNLSIEEQIYNQVKKQYPRFTEEHLQQAVRSRLASYNIQKLKEIPPKPKKDYTKDINLVMGALKAQADDLVDMNIEEAARKQEEEAKERWTPYKLGLEAGTTGAELLAGTYFLTRGTLKGTNALSRRLSRTTNRYGMPVYNTNSVAGKVRAATDRMINTMDKGQTAMSSIGFTADGLQLLQGDNSWINNAELVGDAAGIIGGTNIVRNTPWFGRYRKGIDTTLDAIGYGAAAYDVGHFLFGE